MIVTKTRFEVRSLSYVYSLDQRIRDEAEQMVSISRWPAFKELVAVAFERGSGKVIGTASVLTGDDEILFLVRPDRQGEGVGTALVESLMEQVQYVNERDVRQGLVDPVYRAIAGSEEGASFLASLPNRFGWKAFALISWSGYHEEIEGWREGAARGQLRELPALTPGQHQVYAWPDGSDVILTNTREGDHDEPMLVVRWRGTGDRSPGKIDEDEGEMEVPFALNETLPSDEPVLMNYEPPDVPEPFARKVRGLLSDLGVVVLALVGRPHLFRMPSYVPDERWEQRYDEAKRFVETGAGMQVWFLDVVPRPQIVHFDDWFTFMWGWYSEGSLQTKTLEDGVDKMLEMALVVPESRRAEWEAANVERGTFVLPSPEEVELFRMLGEHLPFFWGRDKLVAWTRERCAGGPP